MSGGNLREVYHFYTMAVTAANGVTLTLANGCNPTTSFAPSSNDIHSHDE